MDSSISPDPFAPDTDTPKEGAVSFPTARFVEAGATLDELAHLQAAFDALSPEAQAARSEQLAGVAAGDLVEMLELGREAGAFDETPAEAEPEPEPEPEPVVGAVEPPPVEEPAPAPEPEPPVAV